MFIVQAQMFTVTRSLWALTQIDNGQAAIGVSSPTSVWVRRQNEIGLDVGQLSNC